MIAPSLALTPSTTAWLLMTAAVLYHNIVPGNILRADGVRTAAVTRAMLAVAETS